ncbi:diguanylate cyclase domain-containing protein [Streptomyces goshikiensis]|uniref:diguanylate cyclase domain-containing protein n=1 Tax=Streptomyces TaxID=1883 RepID=UPI000C2808FF|nr:diguanylate cyclase [Streptomyces sp. CB02120-2]PJN14558.1 hypothetical protein CG724_33235 [Streptomyces sp. CB02120-2]
MVLRAAPPSAAIGRGRGGRGGPSPPRAREELSGHGQGLLWLGGDEFAVVVQLPTAALEQRLAQRMLHTPVVLDDGRTVEVGASIGVSTPHAVGSRDLSLLQRAADAALYVGKHSFRADRQRQCGDAVRE